MHNPLRINPEDLTGAQLMWIDVIHGVITSPRFDVSIGDMEYVLSNMIAKMVSSGKEYLVSQGAESVILQKGLDISRPIHIKKHFYGKAKGTILEHMIPAGVLKRILLASDRSRDSVAHTAMHAGLVTVMTREEDARLVNAGLARRMPDNWEGIGADPTKRYEAVGIRLSGVRITPCGPICR